MIRCAISRGATSQHDQACITRNFVPMMSPEPITNDSNKFSSFQSWNNKQNVESSPSPEDDSPIVSNSNTTTSLFTSNRNVRTRSIPSDRNPWNLSQGFGTVLDSSKSRSKNYLTLDPWMIALDYESLNKLSTAQLMQRLKSHRQPYKGLKHELIERWRAFKLEQQEDSEMILVD